MNVYVVQGCSGSEAAHWTWEVAAFLDCGNAELYAAQANQILDAARQKLAQNEATMSYDEMLSFRGQVFLQLQKYDPTLQDGWGVDFRTTYNIETVPLKG